MKPGKVNCGTGLGCGKCSLCFTDILLPLHLMFACVVTLYLTITQPVVERYSSVSLNVSSLKDIRTNKLPVSSKGESNT